MDVRPIKQVLDQLSLILKHHKHIAKLTGELTGEKFNVFKILGVESSEVRLHSSLLAEFLNPHASHGQGSLYLNIFINHLIDLKDMPFDIDSAKVEVEKYIGMINKDRTKGGRIDILLSDKKDNRIIIENKIYADDQLYQLERYYNFDQNAIIVYLTLDGSQPSKKSIGSMKVKPSLLSYKTDIIQWFEICRKESASLPIVRETIVQYLNLLKELTNQTVGGTMKEEIRRILLENLSYIETIETSSKILGEIIDEVSYDFKNSMKKIFSTTTIKVSENIYIKPICDEDPDGFWFGYKLFEGNNLIIGSQYSINLHKKLQEKMDWEESKSETNENFIFWFYPTPFSRGVKFKDLSKETLIKLSNDKSTLVDFVKELISKEKEVRNELNIIVQNESYKT